MGISSLMVKPKHLSAPTCPQTKHAPTKVTLSNTPGVSWTPPSRLFCSAQTLPYPTKCEKFSNCFKCPDSDFAKVPSGPLQNPFNMMPNPYLSSAQQLLNLAHTQILSLAYQQAQQMLTFAPSQSQGSPPTSSHVKV